MGGLATDGVGHRRAGATGLVIAGSPGFALVVPLYDERDRFADHADAIVDWVEGRPGGAELVFVDDGSIDGTAELVEALRERRPAAPVRLLRRPHAGKGAAVAAGIAATDTPVAGFCDLDRATPLAEFERIVVAATRADVLAIGSRDLAGSHLLAPEGRGREFLGRAYNRLIQATVAPGIVDTQCGAKAARRALWNVLLARCREPGFAWDAELVAVARALGIEVREVAIDWAHDGRSKVHVGRDGAAMVRATPRIWRRARCAARDTADRDTADRSRLGGAGGEAGIRPAIAAGEVFDDANAGALLAADATHWWFRSKAALVATAIGRSVPSDRRAGRLIDLGAGGGGVTAILGWRSDRVVVVEGNHRLAAHARSRTGLATVQAAAAAPALAPGSAEVVCLLDVIEHLDEPVRALAAAAALLVADGRLVVNVPGHRWLWSAADVALGHRRRYTRRSLRAELARAGLEPVLITHVFSWLVVPVWVTRLGPGRRRGVELGLDRSSPWIHRAAMVLTWCERQLLGRVAWGIGTSVLCVARPAPAGP